MKHIFEAAIAKGNFDLPSMLSKIDTYHINGKLTDIEREALYARAREVAKPQDSVDLYLKLVELEERVRKLEERPVVEDDNVNSETGEDNGELETEVIEDYVVGKWYRAGDVCMFKGNVYECIAPEGMVCTWSPDEYPAYWQLRTTE